MNEAKEKIEAICKDLNELKGGLLDIYQDFDYAPAYQTEFSSEKFVVSQENLDEFDWSGMQCHFVFDVDSPEPKQIDWNEVIASIETAIANGHFMEPDASDYYPVRPYGSNVLRQAGAYYKGDTLDTGFMLRQLNRLGDNNVDILSPDDSIFERSYNRISNFEMKVPLEIYGQDEELIIKADIPDILFNSSEAENMNIPFKSVLALLPERINTRQLRPTFIDGQFRLELPKREPKQIRKI